MDAAKLERLLKPILDLYNEIETDLLLSVASRFDTYDSIGGTLDWYIKKLEQMGAFNKDNLAKIIKYSPATKKKIQELLESVSYQTMLTNGTMNLETLMASYVNKRILEDAVASLEENIKLINTKAVESASKAYMDVLTKAYIETSSGAYSYNESIRRALQNMAERGIAGATYQRGSKTVQYSLEGTVRRDVLTKSHQLSVATQMQNMKELGHNLVYVSQHLGARTHPTDKWANHAGWQGKVYMIEGSSEKYENLVEATGYGDITGLAGVNCRHNISSYIEGVTKIPDRIDEDENERIYQLSQQQRALERDVRKAKKEVAVAKQINDTELHAKYRKQLDDSEAILKKFVSSHEELKMDYSRTQTVEQLVGGKDALVLKESTAPEAPTEKLTEREQWIEDFNDSYASFYEKEVTEAEKEILDGYTGYDYRNINRYLNGDTLDYSATLTTASEVEAAISGVDSVMEKFHLNQDVIAYRGTKAKHYADYQVGDTFTEKIYYSTSLNENIASGFGDYMAEIRVPAGTKSIWFGSYTDFDFEAELLLAHGLTYKVISKNSDKIVLEVVK